MKNYSVGAAEEHLDHIQLTKNVKVNFFVYGKSSQEIEDFSILILIQNYRHYQSITKLLLDVNVNKPNM